MICCLFKRGCKEHVWQLVAQKFPVVIPSWDNLLAIGTTHRILMP